MMTITLSSDHRVVDGAQAALFLNDVAEALVSQLSRFLIYNSKPISTRQDEAQY